ncbi:gamma-glutamyl kinase [Phaeobacter sp. B1627]|uniref:gamma-glutamyl kinase n=1 Tax=Phaeobacter sp. B1627 TaxID=2583809 RepID=UPI001119BAE3|nr:gamma-glutamyl kinase [Phaeobacter sp. B1627]TNJ40694.1 gamma-glutamyl kinase [Phaeobacter sp. B1627]
MMVFFHARLVLLSVPKTGTTALMTALRPYADMVISDPPELKHSPVYRYNRWVRPMFDKVCGTELEVVATMREPVDWLGSWYRFRRRPHLDGQPTSTQGMSFDAFVDDYCRGKRPPHANVGSQAKFLEAQPNGCHVSHLFAYENQKALHAFLQDRIGVSYQTKPENVSPQADVTLHEDMLEKLKRKHPEEFALYARIRA